MAGTDSNKADWEHFRTGEWLAVANVGFNSNSLTYPPLYLSLTPPLHLSSLDSSLSRDRGGGGASALGWREEVTGGGVSWRGAETPPSARGRAIGACVGAC